MNLLATGNSCHTRRSSAVARNSQHNHDLSLPGAFEWAGASGAEIELGGRRFVLLDWRAQNATGALCKLAASCVISSLSALPASSCSTLAVIQFGLRRVEKRAQRMLAHTRTYAVQVKTTDARARFSLPSALQFFGPTADRPTSAIEASALRKILNHEQRAKPTETQCKARGI